MVFYRVLIPAVSKHLSVLGQKDQTHYVEFSLSFSSWGERVFYYVCGWEGLVKVFPIQPVFFVGQQMKTANLLLSCKLYSQAFIIRGKLYMYLF